MNDIIFKNSESSSVAALRKTNEPLRAKPFLARSKHDGGWAYVPDRDHTYKPGLVRLDIRYGR